MLEQSRRALCAHVQCLQYKTDQQSDVKKVEKLNNLFFGLIAKGVEEKPEGTVQLAPKQRHYFA